MRSMISFLVTLLVSCIEAPGTGTIEQDVQTADYVQKWTGSTYVDSSIKDDGSRVTTSEKLGGSEAHAWYMYGNELDSGYDQNSASTGYVNYAGYHNGGTQYRNTCIEDGEQNATCSMYFDAANHRVGINTNYPDQALTVYGGMDLAPLGGGTGAFWIASDLSSGHFQSAATDGGFCFNCGTAHSAVDITNDGQVNRTDENPVFTHELQNGNLLTYDTYAADRRVYGNFWDLSPLKCTTGCAGTQSHLLTTIQLRLDARSPDKRVALWNDEGEVWQDTHVMYSVRPNGGGAAAPTISTCGSSATVNGNDNMGRIAVGTGTVNSCLLYFAENWQDHALNNITPACTVIDENGTAYAITPTYNSLTFTCTSCGGHHVVYHCSGTDNNLPAT